MRNAITAAAFIAVAMGCGAATEVPATPIAASAKGARMADCAEETKTRAPMSVARRRPMLVDPVAWWRFEEGAGTSFADLSGNGNGGDLRGATWTTDTAGGSSNGHALAFDGTGIAAVAPSTTLTLTSTFTLMAWIRPTDPMVRGTGGTVGVLAQGRPSGGSGYRLGVESGRANLGMNNDQFNCSLSSKTMLTPKRWTHIAATYDGSTMRVYVDGAADGTSTCASGALVPSHRPVYLGRDHDLPEALRFDGLIDEARVYDVVLDERTVRSLYEEARPGSSRSAM